MTQPISSTSDIVVALDLATDAVICSRERK